MCRGGIAVAMLALLPALGGCNPVIHAYRNMRGLTQDDPNPASAPNTKNLARAEAEPYPNLATVPPPPSGASTAAARERLLASLTKSRTSLEATDRTLRAGGTIAFAAPPLAPPLPPGTGANPPTPQDIMGGARPRQLGPGPRRSGEPPLPGPLESPLASPRIAAIPQPEASRPAPPAPHLAAIAAPAPARLPSAAAATAGFRPTPAAPRLAAIPSPAPPPSAVTAAGFRRAPAPPRLTLLAAPPPAAAGRPKPPAPAAAVKLAEIRFPADATSLAPGDRAILAKVVALYHRRPGMLRVVGFADSGGGARRQLDSFRAALDRAQAVAAALGKAGIPAARIRTEAAPAGVGSDTARAEILLEP